MLFNKILLKIINRFDDSEICSPQLLYVKTDHELVLIKVIAVFVFGLMRHYLTKLMGSPAEGGEASKLLKAVEAQEFEELPKTEAILAECEKESAYRYDK